MLANSDGSIKIKLCVKYNLLFWVSFGGKYLYSQHFTEPSSQRLIARKQKQWKKVSSFFVCVSCTYKSYYSHNHALGLKLKFYHKELFHPHLLLLVKELFVILQWMFPANCNMNFTYIYFDCLFLCVRHMHTCIDKW